MNNPSTHSRAPRTWPLTYKGVPVPYIAAWSAEIEDERHDATLTVRTNLADGAARLIYTDESPADRDRHGVLWHRVAWNPGRGRPLFARVHTARQRRTMARALCQACAARRSVDDLRGPVGRAHRAARGDIVVCDLRPAGVGPAP